jgi:hypothetical protein
MSAPIFLATTGSGLARASAAGDQWTVEHVLAGEPLNCLAPDQHNRMVVYAGTQGNGVLRSDDAGRTGARPGCRGKSSRPWRPAPRSRTLFMQAPGRRGCSSRRDGGAQWTELEAFRRMRAFWWFSPAEPGFVAYVQAIALAPDNPQLLVVGIEAGPCCAAPTAAKRGRATGPARCAIATR